MMRASGLNALAILRTHEYWLMVSVIPAPLRAVANDERFPDATCRGLIP